MSCCMSRIVGRHGRLERIGGLGVVFRKAATSPRQPCRLEGLIQSQDLDKAGSLTVHSLWKGNWQLRRRVL